MNREIAALRDVKPTRRRKDAPLNGGQHMCGDCGHCRRVARTNSNDLFECVKPQAFNLHGRHNYVAKKRVACPYFVERAE